MYYQSINFGNEEFHAYPNKSLYWKRLNTLIVSDLHIGKSISYAKNKQFLPPYDTKEILNKIFVSLDKPVCPKTICLSCFFDIHATKIKENATPVEESSC